MGPELEDHAIDSLRYIRMGARGPGPGKRARWLCWLRRPWCVRSPFAKVWFASSVVSTVCWWAYHLLSLALGRGWG